VLYRLNSDEKPKHQRALKLAKKAQFALLLASLFPTGVPPPLARSASSTLGSKLKSHHSGDSPDIEAARLALQVCFGVVVVVVVCCCCRRRP
jgi:hypothetical protein